ncbi:MAG: hypothetical protein HQL29_05155 [Candidatus Omnitrophica bacterium]|nr:hypothetical protein [Candidatus Omnitrophota bacterium]
MNGYLDMISENCGFHRRISQTKSKNFQHPVHDFATGEFAGYAESDDSYKKRIEAELKDRKQKRERERHDKNNF